MNRCHDDEPASDGLLTAKKILYLSILEAVLPCARLLTTGQGDQVRRLAFRLNLNYHSL